jgi:TRAP-type mannitol/chloroaromatic compound transport system permease small subunit
MDSLLKISKAIDSMSDHLGSFMKWWTVPIMILLVFEVLSRRVFDAPTEWNFFVTQQFFGYFYLLMAPYGLLQNVNIRVDVFYAKFSPKTQAWIDLIGYVLVMLPLCYIAVVYGSQYAMNSVRSGEASMSPMRIPIYQVKTFLPLAFLLLGIQTISEMIKKVRFIQK